MVFEQSNKNGETMNGLFNIIAHLSSSQAEINHNVKLHQVRDCDCLNWRKVAAINAIVRSLWVCDGIVCTWIDLFELFLIFRGPLLPSPIGYAIKLDRWHATFPFIFSRKQANQRNAKKKSFPPNVKLKVDNLLRFTSERFHSASPNVFMLETERSLPPNHP